MALNMITRSNAEALIPEQISNEIINSVPASSAFLQMAKALPRMTSKQMKIPVATGLVDAGFISGDTAQKPTSNLTWDKVYITAEEIAVMVPIPEAVLDDSNYDIWSEVRPRIAEAFGRAIDAAAFYGIGAPSTAPAGGIYAQAVNAGNVVELSGSTKNLYEEILGENGVVAKVEEQGISVNGYVGALALRAKLRGCLDANKQPIFRPAYSNGAAGTMTYEIDGNPVVFPTTVDMQECTEHKGYLIAGNFDFARYAIRQDITYKIFDQGTITDGSGKVVLSAMENDTVILRAVMRIGWAFPKPVNSISGNDYFPFAVLKEQDEQTVTDEAGV